jgi:hypothetical protein
MDVRKLKVLLISDDRPGHYHLSDGITAAAHRIRPVEVNRLTVKCRWSPTALSLLCRAGVPPSWVLRVGYDLAPSGVPDADLIVSAGAETLAANAAVARLLGVPNIFYGSLRWYPAERFTLVLTSYTGKAARPRHVMVMKPSSPMPATMPNAGEQTLFIRPPLQVCSSEDLRAGSSMAQKTGRPSSPFSMKPTGAMVRAGPSATRAAPLAA